VVVAQVPWARHDAGHTRAFDDTVAWLATRCSKSAVVELMRTAWRTVGAVIERVVADAAVDDPLDGLERIGIDEVSYRRGHRYLTVVVDHDRGRLVWVAAGKDKATLSRFFAALGPERCARLRLVSADAADWVPPVMAAYCPHAQLCIDPFHVVFWANRALDQVRRKVWNTARRAGHKTQALRIKQARFDLRRRAEELGEQNRHRLADVVRLSSPLHRAWLLTQALRDVYATGGEEGVALLARWLGWARRCRIPEMLTVARRITAHRRGIEAALRHGLSNGRVESVNAKIRLLTRVAYGFHSAAALIALVKLSLCGYCPPLPRPTHT
jgi:transposase